MSIDDEIKRIGGKAMMRDTVESLEDGDQAILLVWRSDSGQHDGKRHAVQVGCDTRATFIYLLGQFLHDEYEGRFE